jgi:hypothetical protein
MLHLELEKTGDGYRMGARRVAWGFENPIDAAIVSHRVYVLEHGGSGAIWEVTFPAQDGPSFRRGLVNRDSASDLSDAVAILFHLFAGLPVSCPDAADADDSGVLDVTDAVYFLEHLFHGGAAPPAPHGACGTDPTPDPGPGLECEDGPGCEG